MFLDSTKVYDSERLESIKRGKFMKIVKPKQGDFCVREDQNIRQYTPLPKYVRDPNDHKGKLH